jgi:hypothetical protein
VLELGPEVGGDVGREDLDVLGDLLGRAHPERDRRDRRVAERELQGRGRQTHAVAPAYRLDPAHPRHDLGRRRGVLEIGAVHRPGREDAGVVGAADDQRDLAPLAQRQERVERPLLEEGIATGEQKAVDTWEEVTEDFRGGLLGSNVVAYILTVTYEIEVLGETVDRELTIDVIPPDTFSAEIPADFLEPDTEVQIEVAAREESGNRTSKEIFIDVVDQEPNL